MASRSRQPTAAAKKLTLTSVLTLEGHRNAIPSISYFPDGKRMISGSGDKTTRQWDLEAGKEIEDAQDVCEQEVYAVGVSRNGRWIVSAGGYFNIGELKVYEVETETVRRFEGHLQRINFIDISGDSTLLASGSWDGTVLIWSLETGKLAAGPFQSADWVGAIRFSQDSTKLAVKSDAGRLLEVWDIQTQKLDVFTGEQTGSIYSDTYAPVFWTTKTIVTAFSFKARAQIKTIYQFDPSTLETIEAPFKGHTQTITGLALSLDCALLASASHDNTIKLWAFESRQLLASFNVLSTVRHLILSLDSRQLVYTAKRNNSIYLCNIPPEILDVIRPVPQTSAPKNLLLTDSGALSLSQNQPTSEAPPTVQPSFPSHSPQRTQPTEMVLLPDMQQSPTLSPPPQIPSSTAGSQLPQSHSDPRELLPSSSPAHTVFSARDDAPDDLSAEVMLQDLSEYITKDGDYPIARGGFGEIWKCTYRSSVKVAVKALQVYADDQLGPAKVKKIRRIKRELRICANLKHTNILPIFGYTHGFGPFPAIVSPWAENGNLTVYLEREGAALALVRRFQLLRDIIAGLQHLHANSVIHGDFNGPNVLIHGDGTACVADFGLSLMYSEVITASQASWTSTLKGNMRWMAPELLVLEREDGSPTRPSKQSDIFSFGGIMLQVLTNKIPYYYLSNDAAIVLCIARSEKPFRSRYPGLLEKYWRFIEQCWSTDPRDRPSTDGADVTIRDEFDSLSRSS